MISPTERKGPKRAGDRSDLSPYIVHLTRDEFMQPARDKLISIVSNRVIEARSAYGIAVPHLKREGWYDPALRESQKVACFSETPIANIHGLLNPGIWRKYEFRPYGVIFPRSHMLHVGANMVQYLNQYRGNGFEWPVHAYNELIDAAVLGDDGEPDVDRWNSSAIAKVTPFIESIGEWPTGYGGAMKTKEFSFEREWRFAGDFEFRWSDAHGVIVPTGESAGVRAELEDAGVSSAHLDRLAFVEIRESSSAVA